jgi:hypothetical protein
MLPATLRRHVGNRSLKDLEQACWTPSPLTSRVIEGLSALRAILSISSM